MSQNAYTLFPYWGIQTMEFETGGGGGGGIDAGAQNWWGMVVHTQKWGTHL